MRPLVHDTVVTDFDRRRLRGLLQVLRKRSTVDVSNLDALELELERAHVVKPQSLPANVVSMNSRVCLLDVERGDRTTLSLVFPDARNHDGSAVAVLSPLGLALLGCREGDEMEWPMHDGVRRLRVERVMYQPEAAGDYFM
jgi:regulator of nucleoside diphosphate kinase